LHLCAGGEAVISANENRCDGRFMEPGRDI
jgi:hypothetical protein